MSRDDFIFQPMLTCIGNKRKLIGIIEDVILDVKKELKMDKQSKIRILDGFCGSTVVSRMLSYHSEKLYTNDLENYSYIMARCFLQTPFEENKQKINKHIDVMNKLAEEGPYLEGIIATNYAPKDTKNILEGERCFYTRENALIIDTLRKYIEDNVEEELKHYCLAPLLVKASIHTNTAGVFKGFYKKNGIGCFGGAGENALSRITGKIKLDHIVWNGCRANCLRGDINKVLKDFKKPLDVIYFDPPYNQHPYGSNYFMLNLIINNKMPESISKVSGIPVDWNKSSYNKKNEATKAMKELLEKGLEKAKFLMISYNNEGIIDKETWDSLLKDYTIKVYEIDYSTFKGSRNLKDRSDKVVEIIYLVSK